MGEIGQMYVGKNGKKSFAFAFRRHMGDCWGGGWDFRWVLCFTLIARASDLETMIYIPVQRTSNERNGPTCS